jgi:TPP-dependent indolepyruvate ferredoxin oxidoreductase alpha subunit
MEMLSGGEMIVRALEDEGVEYIFGYPGGAALHIYDAFSRQKKSLIFWCATSKQPRMRPMAMRALPGSPVWCW